MTIINGLGIKDKIINARIITPDGEFLVGDVEYLEIDLKTGTVTVKIKGYTTRYDIDDVNVELL